MRFLPRHGWLIFPLSVLVLLVTHGMALAYRVNPSVSLWFPPSGAAIALTLWFGPLGIVATALSSIIAAPWWNVHGWMRLLGCVDAIEPLVVWVLYRYILGGSLQFHRLRDAVAFVLSGPIVASALSAGVGNSLALLLGKISVEQLSLRIPYWWLGNAIGIMAIAPAALLYFTPYLQNKGYLRFPEDPSPAKPLSLWSLSGFSRAQIGQWLLILALSIGTSALTVLKTSDSDFLVQQFSFLSFLPIIWAATFFGVRGGIFSASLCVFVTLITYRLTYSHLLSLPDFRLAEVLFAHKLSLLVQCGVGFFVGCATSERAVTAIALAEERIKAREHQARAQLSEQLIYANRRLEASNQEKDVLLEREQQLRGETEAIRSRLTRILESISEAFFSLDRQGCFSYVNSQAAQLLQRPMAELLGQPIWELYPEAINTRFYQEYQKAIAYPSPVRFEAFYAPFNLWVEVQAYPTSDGLSVFCRDISDRKQIEAALRESEERFRSLSVSSPVGIFQTDIEGNHTYINPRFENICGLTLEQLQGLQWLEWVYQGDRDLVANLWKTCISQGKEGYLEYRFGQTPQTLRWVQVRCAPMRSEIGELMGYVGTVEDVTVRKQVEDFLRQSETRFTRLAKNVPGVIYQYRQREKYSSGEFIYISPVCRELLELDPQVIMANADLIWQLVHPEDLESFQNSILQTVHNYWETGELTRPRPQWRWEWRIITPSHTLKWLQGVAHAEVQPDGTLLWDGLLLDITERKAAEFALQESEAKFRRLVEANIFGVAIGDFSGQITYANEAFLQMLGYDREAVFTGQMNWNDLTPLEYSPVDTQLVQDLREAGIAAPFEKEYFRKDGSRVPVLVGAALLDEGRAGEDMPHEEARSIIGFYLDLTNRKQAEAALRESEERLHLILDASQLGMWYSDLPFDIWICNKNCKEHFGLPPDIQVTIDLFYACLHPDDRESTRLAIERSLSSQTAYDQEFRTRGPDGRLRWIRAKGRGFYEDNGKAHRFDGITIDITATKQAEAEREYLLTRERQYATQLHGLMNASMVMNATLSVETAIQAITEQALSIIGAHQAIARVTLNGDSREPTTLVSCALSEPYGAWRGAENQLELLHLVREGECLEKSMRMTQAQLIDDPRWSTLHHEDYSLLMRGWLATPLRDRNDRIIGLIQLSDKVDGEFSEEDETILVQLAQMASVAIENTRLYEAEQRARTHAEAANRIKDEFLAVLSHELRTPLNPILGWAKLLRTRKFDEAKVERALETIERNALLQTQLIEDLLDVSRILRGKLSMNARSVYLQRVIEAALETVSLAAQAKSIEIEANLEAHLGPISGDPNRLQQIVWNLLSNAVKFTPNGGQVTVRLSSQGGYAQIQVQDTGAGISPSFLPHVFDYFRQENSTSTRAFGGLGLGLAIVRYLVELHGGTVRAESPGDGLGATFTVKFPLMLHEQPESLDQAVDSDSTSLQGLRILVVDDEPDTRELLSFCLEQYGASVLAVSSATAALEAIALCVDSDRLFDLLLSDIGMPKMDGYQLIQQIRSLPPEQGGNLPAIALTAYAAISDQQNILQAGFQRHVTKPIEPAALAMAIANLVNSPLN